MSPHPPPDERYDVAVVGGGPAGSHLALRLGRLGRRVALIEARTFPRPKPCGEFMSPACLGLLEELGLLRPVLDAGACSISRMEFHGLGRSARGRYLDASLRGGRSVHGLALRREVLDEISFRAAARHPGVTLFEGRRVAGILREGTGPVEGVRLSPHGGATLDLRAAFTVGADGLRSVVARALHAQRAEDTRARKLAFVCRFAGVPSQPFAEVHFLDHGYLIAAPVDHGLMTLNLIVERDRWTGGTDRLAYVRARIREAPLLEAKLGSARVVGEVLATGPLAAATHEQVFDGAALVGDACGFVDPLTGEGLYFAMRGAQMLAPVLDRALAAGRRDRGALEAYARARRRELGPRNWMARALQGCVRRPRLARRVLHLLSARPGLMDVLLTVTGDSISPLRALEPRVLLPALRRRAGPSPGPRIPWATVCRPRPPCDRDDSTCDDPSSA